MIYELREYVAHEDTTDKVHDRFRDATLPLFQRHGLDVVGFWVDVKEPHKILYLLRFNDVDQQTQAWSGFQQDPEWKSAKAESEADGPIVASMTSRSLETVPYWPQPEQGVAS